MCPSLRESRGCCSRAHFAFVSYYLHCLLGGRHQTLCQSSAAAAAAAAAASHHECISPLTKARAACISTRQRGQVWRTTWPAISRAQSVHMTLGPQPTESTSQGPSRQMTQPSSWAMAHAVGSRLVRVLASRCWCLAASCPPSSPPPSSTPPGAGLPGL